MLSLSHNFLFIHVPKTAGNAIQGALSAYADDNIVRLAPHQDGIERFEVRSAVYATVKHSTLADYRREYGEDLSARLYKFCGVRNPWDRCISHFFSPHRGRISWDRQAFLEFVAAEVRPLRHYITADPNNRDPLSACVANMNCVIRYESLQADFESACRSIGIPHVVVLPRRNASEKDDYAKYYDSASAAVIADSFAEEIDYFGYSHP